MTIKHFSILLAASLATACATQDADPNGAANQPPPPLAKTAKYQYSSESFANESGPAKIPTVPQHVLTAKRVVPVIYIRDELRTPPPPPPPAPVFPSSSFSEPTPPPPPRDPVHLTVHFPFDSTELSNADKESILASLNSAGKIGSALVVGFTDSIGSTKYNDKLSAKRANAVREFLISQKIDPSTIRAEAHGEMQPVASNNTENGRKMNRRAEIDFKP